MNRRDWLAAACGTISGAIVGRYLPATLPATFTLPAAPPKVYGAALMGHVFPAVNRSPFEVTLDIYNENTGERGLHSFIVRDGWGSIPLPPGTTIESISVSPYTPSDVDTTTI